MARVEHDVVVDLAQALEALDHQLRVAAGQVGAAASVEEQGVARDELAPDEEALAAGRVARRVDELDLDVADRDDVAGVVADELVVGDAGRTGHPGTSSRCTWIGHETRSSSPAIPSIEWPIIEPPT